MSEYAKEIGKIPLLSNVQTKQLIMAFKNGDTEAREKLIKHNLRLVLRLAYKYKKRIELPIEDLISIGSFGLINAIDRYDLKYNVKLSTIAYKCIENAFKQHIYSSKRKMRDDKNVVMSLQDQIYEGKDGDGLTLEGIIEADELSIDEKIIQSIKNESVRNVLEKLTREEREMIYLRFGVVDGVEYTLEEIGKLKGLSKQRIRQKEEKVLKKLRHPKITRQIKDFVSD